MELQLPDAKVTYYANFIDDATSNAYYNLFLSTFNFARRYVDYGKDGNENKGLLNRATCAFGDTGLELPDIWGEDIQMNEWTPEMLEIKALVEEATKTKYNICLCNYYNTRKRTIGWHADREELGDTQSIASISFGDERPFSFRRQGEKEVYKSLILGNGSLLWMGPGTQENYQHSIPQVKLENAKDFKGRINLTFRKFHPENYAKKYL